MSRRKRRQFTEEFKTQMVQMYNNKRIHGSLNYLSPVKYKNMSL